jgi:hypothetical protein
MAILGRGLAAMHAALGRQKPVHTGLAEAFGAAGRLYAPEGVGTDGLVLRKERTRR